DLGAPGKVNGIEITPEADRCPGGPDLPRIRRPGETLHAAPPFAEQPLLSGRIHNCDITGIVPNQGMVEKSDPVSLGRNAKMTDPAICFVQEFADGILETKTPLN